MVYGGIDNEVLCHALPNELKDIYIEPLGALLKPYIQLIYTQLTIILLLAILIFQYRSHTQRLEQPYLIQET